MKRILLGALGLLLVTAAYAADNTVVVTPGSGVTMKSKDVGSGVQAMQPIISDASGNALGTQANPLAVSTANTTPVSGTVTCANCTGGAGPYNVTVTNIADGVDVTLGAKADSAITTSSSTGTLVAFVKGLASLLSTLNTTASSAVPAGTNAIGSVTCTNCTTGGPYNVTITSIPAHNVTITNIPAVTNNLTTSGGWTPLLLNGLTTTVTTVKNAAGQLGRLYCYNPNSSVAYVQTFNLTPSSVTLGTTTPTNSYAIAATAIGGFGATLVGDQYSAAISVAATTTAKGLTAPSTALDCNASYN